MLRSSRGSGSSTPARPDKQVHLAREVIDAPSVYGFPLDVGPELVLLAVVDDWRLDGYAVVRLADVSAVRSDERDRFAERVLAGEGELGRLAPPSPPVPVGSWRQAFEALRASGRYVLVHEEANEDEPMTIGPIVGVREDAVLIHYVGATAEWDSEPSAIALTDVTRVQFSDRYSSVFARYADASRPAV